MLESLNRVKWRKARHAYGSARDVPAMLRELASEDEDVRVEALDALDATLCDRGQRWEAAALAVPFLFELVLDPGTPDRQDLVFFLVTLAFGHESEFLPFSTTAAEQPHWMPEDRAAYDAVAERIISLVPLLREAEPLRLAAAYALGYFPRVAAGTMGDVRRAYDDSTDETSRATLLIALAMSSLHSPNKNEVVSLFRSVHGGDGSVIVRASAAAGLALLGAADDDVLKTISAAVIGGSTRLTEIPWNGGDFVGYLARVLPSAAAGRELEVAATLIDALPRADAFAKTPVTRALLDLVVPSAGYRALSALQRQALKAIDEHGEWSLSGGAVVNFALTPNRYGLPSDREDFHAFVQAAEASARGETVEWKPRERPPKPARADPPDSPAGLFFMFLGWALFLYAAVSIAHGRDVLPGIPRAWGVLVISVMLLASVSAFFAHRRKSVRDAPTLTAKSQTPEPETQPPVPPSAK